MLGMIHGRLQGKGMIGLLIVIFLGSIHVQAGAEDVLTARGDPARYTEIQRLIKKNRHLSAHLVLAVDAKTIRVVRIHITGKDILILVQMMGDKDYGVASAASGLLVTLGKQAMPALLEATRSRNSSTVSQARSALRLLDDCYNEALRNVMNPDVCPNDSSGGSPRHGHH